MDTTQHDAPPHDEERVASNFALDEGATNIQGAWHAYRTRLKGGDLGLLPAVLSFLVLCLIFSIFGTNFLTARNIANLFTQASWVVILGMGITFVLLLGEIDLSAGATAGVCAVTMAWLLDKKDVTGLIAIPAAVLIGAAIGLLTGWLVAKVGIPSFVVTLAFFLAWQGVVLQIAKEGGTIRVDHEVIFAINNRYLAPWLGWVLWAIVVGGYLGASLLAVRERARSGVAGSPMSVIALKTGAIAVLWGLATVIFNRNRGFGTKPLQGVPVAVPVVLVLLVVLTFLLTRTRWGRHLYAVGGNAEAARRAGINVDRMRMSGFVTCSSLAAVAGMAIASQLSSVSPQTGGNDAVLLGVASAVIGGTSLFGGRGRAINAVIGGLVVALIPNGMGLVGKKGAVDFSSSGPKFIATGLILLLAASVDALTRKRR